MYAALRIASHIDYRLVFFTQRTNNESRRDNGQIELTAIIRSDLLTHCLNVARQTDRYTCDVSSVAGMLKIVTQLDGVAPSSRPTCCILKQLDLFNCS